MPQTMVADPPASPPEQFMQPKRRTMDCTMLKKRFELQRSNRKTEEPSWDQIERWVMPLGGSGPGDLSSKVEYERTGIWDFTAIDGNQKLAANLFSTVTPSALRWFRFTFRNKELMDDMEAREWLDDVSDITADVLQDSDFNSEVASGYQEYTGYGNMMIICEVAKAKWGNAWAGLDFTAIPLREAYFEENSTGGLYAFYRHLRWTAVQMHDKWGDNIPERIKAALQKDDSGITKYDIVFAIWTRDPKDVALDSKTKHPLYPAAPDVRPFGSCYFLLDDCGCLGDEDGYYEMPAFLARWERTGKSAWGHGPGIHSLSTVRYLNSWCEIAKTGAAMQVLPVTFVTEQGMLGDFDFSPGKTNVAASKDDVWVHDTRSNQVAADQTIQDLRIMVRQIFHVDDLQLKESPEMTATEAQIRYELMQRVLGSTLSRLQSEFLGPMLELVVAILMRAGRLPKAPQQVLAMMDKIDLNIEYQGPLSRAQRTDEVAAIERLGAQAAGLSKFFPQVLDVFDPVKAIREIAKRLGVPASVLVSEQDVMKKAKERDALQSQMARAEAARASGEAVQQGADAQAAVAAAGAQSPVNIPGLGAPNVVNSPAAPPLA